MKVKINKNIKIIVKQEELNLFLKAMYHLLNYLHVYNLDKEQIYYDYVLCFIDDLCKKLKQKETQP